MGRGRPKAGQLHLQVLLSEVRSLYQEAITMSRSLYQEAIIRSIRVRVMTWECCGH